MNPRNNVLTEEEEETFYKAVQAAVSQQLKGHVKTSYSPYSLARLSDLPPERDNMLVDPLRMETLSPASLTLGTTSLSSPSSTASSTPPSQHRNHRARKTSSDRGTSLHCKHKFESAACPKVVNSNKTSSGQQQNGTPSELLDPLHSEKEPLIKIYSKYKIRLAPHTREFVHVNIPNLHSVFDRQSQQWTQSIHC